MGFFSARIAPFRSSHFRRRQAYAENYRQLAAALTETIEFDAVLDVGCGQGLLLQPLAVHHGKQVRGIELSADAEPHVDEAIRPQVVFGDPLGVDLGPSRFELVACVEVVEHVPEERADEFLRMLTERASKWLYLSAAIPGQPGRGHINLQPSFYWIEKLDRLAFSLDIPRTRTLVGRIHGMRPCAWLPQNALLFRRRSA